MSPVHPGADRTLFVRDHDGYVATELTQGGWDPHHANGGTVLALVGQHLDAVPSLVPMTVARLTADLVRPIPIGERLHVDSAVTREGKKIQLVELIVRSGDVELTRVTALRLRDESSGDATPPDTVTGPDRPADALTPPEESTGFAAFADEVPGFLRAVDMRKATVRTPGGTDGTSYGAWIRLDADVVEGEPVTPTARLAFTFDYANLIGLQDHPVDVSMINPDVSAHVLRAPAGEWIAITGDTRFRSALGRGVSDATISDEQGPFAFVSMCQLVQRR